MEKRVGLFLVLFVLSSVSVLAPPNPALGWHPWGQLSVDNGGTVSVSDLLLLDDSRASNQVYIGNPTGATAVLNGTGTVVAGNGEFLSDGPIAVRSATGSIDLLPGTAFPLDYIGVVLFDNYGSNPFNIRVYDPLGAPTEAKLEISGFNAGVRDETLTVFLDDTGAVSIGDEDADGTLKLDVEGPVGATQYCDEAGLNCFTALAASSQQSFWTDSGNNIYNTNTGNVGVGTAAPASRLQIGSSVTGEENANNYIIFGDRVGSAETNPPFLGHTSDQIDGSGVRNDLGLGTRSGSGRIRFFTGLAGVFDPAFERMAIDHVGNVGIGTTAPAYRLSVAGAGGTNEAGISIGSNEGGGFSIRANDATANPVWRINTNSGEDMAFMSGAVERFRMSAGGNLGIGRTAPGERLDVLGDGRFVSDSDVTNSFASGVILVQNLAGTNSVNIDSNEIMSVGTELHLQAESVQDLNVGAGDLFVETTSGSVGLGTITPSDRLHVMGEAVLEEGSRGIRLSMDNTGSGRSNLILDPDAADGIGAGSDYTTLGMDGSDSYIWNTGGGPIYFSQGSTGHVADSSMVIDGSGDVGIGTSAPLEKVHVRLDQAGGTNIRAENQGTAANSFATVEAGIDSAQGTTRLGAWGGNDNGGFRSDGGFIDTEATLTGGLSIMAREGNADIRFYAGGSADGDQHMVIQDDGNIGVGTTTPNTPVGAQPLRLDVEGGAVGAPYFCDEDGNDCFTASEVTGAVGGGGSFWSDAGSNNINSANSGNVGIGTSSPVYKLHVAVGATDGLYVTTTGSYGLYTSGAVHGVRGFGTSTGVRGEDTDGSGIGRVGYGDVGIDGRGNDAGVYGADLDESGIGRLGWANIGAYGEGSNAGVYGADSDNSGIGRLGYGNVGVDGRGTSTGVYGEDTDSGTYGRLGTGNTGVYGYGTSYGVQGNDDSGNYGRLGTNSYGVYGSGSGYGGYFNGGAYGVRGEGSSYGVYSNGRVRGSQLCISSSCRSSWPSWTETPSHAIQTRVQGSHNNCQNEDNQIRVCHGSSDCSGWITIATVPHDCYN